MREQWTTIVGTVKRAFVVLGEEIPLTPQQEAMLGIAAGDTFRTKPDR
jgi:hypothetical protein